MMHTDLGCPLDYRTGTCLSLLGQTFWVTEISLPGWEYGPGIPAHMACAQYVEVGLFCDLDVNSLFANTLSSEAWPTRWHFESEGAFWWTGTVVERTIGTNLPELFHKMHYRVKLYRFTPVTYSVLDMVVQNYNFVIAGV